MKFCLECGKPLVMKECNRELDRIMLIQQYKRKDYIKLRQGRALEDFTAVVR